VIGEPNQAIYGFRGADATCFERFVHDFPSARRVDLKRNYRSTGAIVTAASTLVDMPPDGIVRPMQGPIVLHVAASEDSEADFVAATIGELMGGHHMLSANRGKNGTETPVGFADFAVLYRTDAQSAALRKAFDRAGVNAILGVMNEQRESLAEADAGLHAFGDYGEAVLNIRPPPDRTAI
jgi:superfamily I DNA/RNA helicase